MESPETLAIESFSRSWLTSVNPSLQGLETALGASPDSPREAISEELDYRMQNSRRSLEEDQNFNFYFPVSQSPDALLHADQLFSDGLIRPVFINQSKNEASSSLNLAPNVPSSLSSKTVSAVQILCRFLGRWKRILPKCFGYVRPLSHRVRDSRISTRVDNVERIAWEGKSQSNSREASPSRRVAYSLDGCHDSERSIHDAVLHCKRSMHK
ncbi:membrane-associated kinase regulator 6 [Populus alba x Populus x berolinensis]|nr:membrane-associated kinase regulator 6 [Populus alba x Populus x berolinensis]